MPILRFTDGVEIDTSGEYRPYKDRDGWYVVGHGILMAVDSLEEAEKEIEILKQGPRYFAPKEEGH